MSQKSSLYRTIEILKELNAGKKLCVTNLATAYEVSDRTIRRDFELIKEIFGNFMSKEGECYQAYQKVLLEEVLNATDLMTLANIVNLFGITQKESLISDKTKALIEQSMSVYNFKSRPFENMSNRDILKKLEHAIKFKKEIKIRYRTERAITQDRFRPYKILFLNENFYLVGTNASKEQVEYRRITMIEDVAYTKKGFFTDKDVEKFFSSLQTPWASYGKEEIVVRLRAEVSIRRYFVKKKYLPSQEVVHTFENGDIEVQYRISNFREIEELIIKRLPRIHVISPRNLQKMIKKSLEKKMSALKTSSRSKLETTK
jgi:predicted DNA-binding transcriptional regulator YafY